MMINKNLLECRVGRKFAEYLICDDFENGYDLLDASLKNIMSIQDFKIAYQNMIEAYNQKPIVCNLVQSIVDFGKKDVNNVGCAYASIDGDDYSEAVTIIINDSGLIREIIWGRP
jgi:hypothetical protein